MKALLVAWFASALALSGATLTWMFLTASIEGAVLPLPLGIVRGGLFALVLGLVFQFGYGGLVYVILTRTGLWNIWTVSLAYLLPVVLFSYHANDTTQGSLGTIPWLVFALIVALVTWSFVPRPLASQMVRTFPEVLNWIGLVIVVMSLWLAVDLVWEQTVLPRNRGPQLIGLSLMYSGLGILLLLAFLGGLVWIAAVAIFAVRSRSFGIATTILVVLYGLAWVLIATRPAMVGVNDDRWQRLELPNRGSHMGRPPKLTLHQRQEALARREAGESLSDIAYGVAHTTIGRL